MAMVFAADGLDGSEKLLLLAYTNYTDPHGYCWPGEDRLAEDTGTSPSTVRRTKKKLISRNLLKSIRRPETSNLARVNLPLLSSMARPRKAYDDNEVERLSFGGSSAPVPETGSDQRTVQSDLSPSQGSDLRTVQSDLDHRSDCSDGEVNLTCARGQSDLQSISDPSVETTTSSPVSVQLAPEAQPAEGGGGGDAPQPEKDNTAAAAFVDRLPFRGKAPDKQQRSRMIAGVVAALSAGWSELALKVQLTEETESAKSLVAVYLHRLSPKILPDAPPLPKPRTGEAVSSVAIDDRPRCEKCRTLIRKSAAVDDLLCKECRSGLQPAPASVVNQEYKRAASVARQGIVKAGVRRG